jgi:hypothetical protein
MTSQLPLEYDIQREILPALAAGLVLNLVGRYFADAYLQLTWTGAPNFLFLDQVGTAFVAVLLGPWWAATVGILGSAMNGLFAERFFPFGTTSIAAALVWGYATRFSWTRSRLRFSSGEGTAMRGALEACALLAIVGAITAAAMSTTTKIILYPRLGLPLDLNRQYYRAALEMARTYDVPFPAVSSLFAGDLIREFVDKSLTVAVALAFVIVFGFIPSGAERDDFLSRDSRLREQLKVSALSLFTFTIVYAFFLFAARLATPQITYPEASRSIFWLQDRTVVMLLYSPLLAVLTAFALGSFDSTSRLGRWLNTERRRRTEMYRRMSFRAGEFEWSELSKVIKRDSVYGLLAAILLWRQQLSSTGSAVSVLYFIVAAVFATVFFRERRQFAFRWYRAKADLEALHNWLEIGARGPERRPIIDIVAEDFGREALICASHDSHTANLDFRLCIVEGSTAWARQLAQQNRNDRLLLATSREHRTMSERVCQAITDTITNSGSHTALILTMTPEPIEGHVAEWLRHHRDLGREVLLIGWEDVEDAIFASVRKDDIERQLAYARVRAMSDLAAPLEGSIVEMTPVALGARALRGVSHLLKHLPRESNVFDFGAGRGRHTFAAALHGHHVVAVERRSQLRAEIVHAAEQSGLKDVTVLDRDYRRVRPAEIGVADLLIVTGVLQHCRSRDELAADLEHFKTFLASPGSMMYVEMLFNMTFDGQLASDGRYFHTCDEFESHLLEAFPRPWRVERVRGPYCRRQDFSLGARSFVPVARIVQSTSVEYLVTSGA